MSFTAVTLMLALVLFGIPAYSMGPGSNAPRMTKEHLRDQLGNPNFVIVDVRLGKDWDNSKFKIKGAVRESSSDISWAEKYPKDRTIVLYCA
jgi:rhodanese-related sulfurtransferase